MIGSTEFEKAIKKISSSDAIKIAEGIGIALEIEKEAGTFYSEHAKKFLEKETADFFNFLAGQEKEHFETISGLKKALEKKQKWTTPSLSGKKPVFFAKKEWDKTESKESITIILFALWKEKQAREFYSGIAAVAKSKSIKDFFNDLADFEKGHAEMLESFVENSFYTSELIMG